MVSKVERLRAPRVDQEAGGEAVKVLHVIPSLSLKHGGPSQALPVMARSLAAVGVEVDVVATDDDGPGCRLNELPLAEWLPQGGWRLMYFAKQTEFYKASWPLWRWLRAHARDYEVIHIHAVFSFATLAAGWAARMAGVPFVIRPLGTLNAWGMKNRRRWLKTLSFRLLDKPVLDRAAALHFTSTQEVQEAAALGIKAWPVMLPLGFELEVSAASSRDALDHEWPECAGREVILYLSRLDEKKGLDVLLRAFAKIHAQCPSAMLLIAGDGDAALKKRLMELATDLGIAAEVLWAGQVRGERKQAALGGATLYVLPSHSENFGIALLEAMSAGLPCVTTEGVALAREPDCAEALIRVPVNDAEALAEAMQKLLASPDLRQQLSAAAKVAASHYSTETMAAGLVRLYDEVTAS